ncbi:hypothetical protein LIER_12601 [Lithospermum erythrorhizon]|uniref:Uncharacterized protein n=1 Tax=Lithospermum erythrorhizon TaxID=34254 RepID=A0AAV3PU82_LITER
MPSFDLEIPMMSFNIGQTSDLRRTIEVVLWSFRAIPSSQANFLRLSTFTFVSSGLKYTMDKLERNYGLEMRNVVDMGPLTAETMSMPNSRAESLVCDYKFYGLSFSDNGGAGRFIARNYFSITNKLIGR